MIVGAIIFSMSCSSIKFIPRTGVAGKLNLATVEYVNDQRSVLQQEIVAELSPGIEAIVADLLKNDRQTIEELKTLVDQQQALLVRHGLKLDSTNTNMANVAGKLMKDLAALKTTNNDMKLMIDKMKTEMTNQPDEALIRLRELLNGYLEKPPAKK